MIRRTAPNLFVYANDRSTMATALVPCFASSIRDHRVFPRTYADQRVASLRLSLVVFSIVVVPRGDLSLFASLLTIPILRNTNSSISSIANYTLIVDKRYRVEKEGLLREPLAETFYNISLITA